MSRKNNVKQSLNITVIYCFSNDIMLPAKTGLLGKREIIIEYFIYQKDSCCGNDIRTDCFVRLQL